MKEINIYNSLFTIYNFILIFLNIGNNWLRIVRFYIKPHLNNKAKKMR